MAGKAHERLGSKRGESRWCLEGDDGDRASDNRSTEETWPLDAVLHPLQESGRWGSEVSGETRNGSILFDIRTKELQRSIYNLYMRGQVRGDDREGGRAAYSTKAKLWMSKSY